MNAQVQRGRLIPAWLGGGSAAAGGHAAADPVAQRRRTLWREAEVLLATHDLEPSPANYAIAHAYASGDPAVRRAVDEAAAAPGGLTEAALEVIASARDANAVSPDMLAKMAEKLESRLAEALQIVGQQVESARDYGDALDSEAQNVAVDPVGTFGRLIAMTREVVSATRAMEERLDETRREAEKLRSDLTSARRAADRDHLTGLPNRRYFDAQLATGGAGEGCLALCDIDDFKRINDAHGHETGDRVLRFVAKTLKEELKGQALVARYGGEEFACLFEHADVAAARAALDQLRARLCARSLVDRASGVPLGQLTFSAGLAPIAGQARAALRAADAALYVAKAKGKDRVEVAPPRAAGTRA